MAFPFSNGGLARRAHRVPSAPSGAPVAASSPHPLPWAVRMTVAHMDHPLGTCQRCQKHPLHEKDSRYFTDGR